MDRERIETVASAIAALGYDGIVTFDRAEPEYGTFDRLHGEFESEAHLALLGVCAGTADYQLAGDAQQYWSELEAVTMAHGQLRSESDVKQILGEFLGRTVNTRLTKQKRKRLFKLFDKGFTTWFVETYPSHDAYTVWERLAEALDTSMEKKTIVFSMKVYDIVSLITSESYNELPEDVPIPCDLQVKRVAWTAGITDSDDDSVVMAAWADVMEEVSRQLDRPVSLLRIDSIVWQAGQIIGDHQQDTAAARRALIDHFREVGVPAGNAETLARELTMEIGQ